MMGAESAAAQRRRQRRIPSEARKRNAQSCDRCRKRRCKCVPSWNGSSCTNCQELNIACSYTAPRKTRFYGSVDDLSDRVRCLEAVVKGAFPNDLITTAEDVHQLGQKMGYPMPDLNDDSRPFLKLEDMVRSADNSVNAPSQPGSNSARHQTGGCKVMPSQQSRTRANSEDPQVSLVRDTAGHAHYIGPSGTLSFLGQLRKLVDQHATVAPAADVDGVNKFVQDDTVQALEADQEYERNDDENTTNTADSIGPDNASPGSITSAIARDFTRLPSADMEEILNQFPQDETLELLVNAYFKHVHDDFPLFHRATFEEEFELFIVRARRWPSLNNARNRPLPDWGWIGCLHMIIVFGSIAQPKISGVDHAALRRRCVTATRVLLPQFVAKCTITNVRVLLLLSLFLHNNNERNAAWNLVGTATRICFALGLHRADMGATFRPIERETRKRVFCTLYSFEQFLAASLGRPSGVQETEVDAVPPREGFLDGSSGSTDSKLMSMSLSLHSILSKTRLIYLDKKKRNGSAVVGELPTTEVVLSALKEWKDEISQIAGFDLPWIRRDTETVPSSEGMRFEDVKASLAWRTRTQLRAVLLLHIQYHYIALTATRPQLLRDVASVRRASGVPPQDVPFSVNAQLCVKHACQLGYLILLLDSFEVINGLWGLDIFYAYCAAMVLILRLLRPKSTDRQVEQHEDGEHLVEEAARGLVTSLQEVMQRTEKGGSMRRFSQVVETFSRCIDKPGSRLVQMTSGQYYPEGSAPGLQQQLCADGMSSAVQPHPQFYPTYNQGPVDNMLGLLPLSTFGGQGSEFNGQPMMNDNFVLPEWSDMEMFFGGYGVQG